MIKFPYGICDFYKLMTGGYFYIDRTNRIPRLEDAGEQLVFLRPRRFGKSLLLSMLENYYDVAKADEFDRLFGHLAIGKNPTPKHNQYLVLNWDFSAVSPQGEPEQIRQALHDHINGCIEQFIVHYRDISEYRIQIDPSNALRSFQSVLAAVQSTPYKLYLLIDEYDNFANEVMMSRHAASKERYQSLLYGEGALKTVFKAVKAGTKGMGLDRAFITGVSPVVMSDITSGHNIAENISLEPDFSDLCGFQETEIARALRPIVSHCALPENKADEVLEMMRTFYNGHCFGYRVSDLIYNPTLALYFLKAFQRTCQYPEEMLDENLAMDRGKLLYISHLPNGEQIILDALNEQNPLTIQRFARRFGVEDLIYVKKDQTFMVSLLYYFGMLTPGGRTQQGKLAFRIPNLVVRGLYFEQIQEMLLPDLSRDDILQVAEIFYSTGNIQPLCEFVEQRYFKVFDNRDYRWANELTVKTAF